MMQSDLRNLRLLCDVMDRLHLHLGFDLASVIREYNAQVGAWRAPMRWRPGRLGVWRGTHEMGGWQIRGKGHT